MRHAKQGRKLGRPHKERLAMLKNLAISILLYEGVDTTEAKAKEVRAIIDRSISKARKGNLHDRRQLLSYFNNNEQVVKKLFESLAPRYEERTSGYTTMVKLPPRKGDNASMVHISLMEA